MKVLFARTTCIVSALLLLGRFGLCSGVRKQTGEERASQYLESIRQDPNRLQLFMRGFPKGGDLHNHLSGAVYAESFLQYAAAGGLCLEVKTLTLIAPPCNSAEGKPPVTDILRNQDLYNQAIDAFSMRDFHPAVESGHDHFFNTFSKFFAVSQGHTGEMIAEARAQAARDHVQYLELMVTPEDGSALLGQKIGWNDDLATFRQRLLASGFGEVVATGRRQLENAYTKSEDILGCRSANPVPGCSVAVRFLYQVLRGLPRQQVFAQILAGFELASADTRVVGLNLVMPEDGYVSMHDFDLHMRMLDFLHSLYPKVAITLHAGELTSRLVPPSGLYHIRASIEKGHARRIGHGVDVMEEPAAEQLLHEMAARHILVEICLTSNAEILGVAGADHPLPEYLRAGVPVALATDDEGVSRSDLTHEFITFVKSYGADYRELKTVARNSLQYSFLTGQSLWMNDSYAAIIPDCSQDSPSGNSLSSRCAALLHSSDRAREQWKLEGEFMQFESSPASHQ
jgi:hypothetical protein